MPQYRTRPIAVEATQFLANDTSTHDLVSYGYLHEQATHPLDGKYWIATPDGECIVKDRDYIVTDAFGRRCVCKPDVFALTYEPATVSVDLSVDLNRSPL